MPGINAEIARWDTLTDGGEHATEIEAMDQQTCHKTMTDLPCIGGLGTSDDGYRGHDHDDENHADGEES